MTGALREFQRLIDAHASAWSADCDAWNIYGDIEDIEAMEAQPRLRVQIGWRIVGRDENNADVKEPRFFTSVAAIEAEYHQHTDLQISLFGHHRSTEWKERMEASCKSKIDAKVAELHAIEAERQKIQDACGYTGAQSRAKASSAAVRAVERQIIDFVPDDIETARQKAAWIANAFEKSIGYIDDNEDNLLGALKAIAGVAS